LALEEKTLLKLLKRIWPGRKEVLEIMKKKMPPEKFEMWKRKLLQISQSQNPLKLMILMKTWMVNTISKTNWINQLKNTLL
jgi:hypothetical protein